MTREDAVEILETARKTYPGKSVIRDAFTLALAALQPSNEPLTCVGCIYEPDCPSEIHCHGCARIFVDHYRRPPEGEA